MQESINLREKNYSWSIHIGSSHGRSLKKVKEGHFSPLSLAEDYKKSSPESRKNKNWMHPL